MYRLDYTHQSLLASECLLAIDTYVSCCKVTPEGIAMCGLDEQRAWVCHVVSNLGLETV